MEGRRRKLRDLGKRRSRKHGGKEGKTNFISLGLQESTPLLPGSCESRDLLIACHRNLKYQFLKILFLLHSRTGTCASLGEGKEKLV
jgi:hypothetical protein